MPTQEDFLMALAIAQKEYKNMEPARQAERSGALWSPSGNGPEGSGTVELPFLGTPYVIQGPEGEVGYKKKGGKEPDLWEKIIVLHYFNTADGSALAQKWISVKEIPDSRLYLPNFEKRAEAPLLGRFGNSPEEIRDPARALGGRQADVGDVSVTVPVFPRVPITLLFWKGDEEFPPRIQILFDQTIVRYLPTEDIILASQMLAFRLIGLAKKG
jgi:hypothetical protein